MSREEFKSLLIDSGLEDYKTYEELQIRYEILKSTFEGYIHGTFAGTMERQEREAREKKEILNTLELAYNGLTNNTAIKDYCLKVLNKYKE